MYKVRIKKGIIEEKIGTIGGREDDKRRDGEKNRRDKRRKGNNKRKIG